MPLPKTQDELFGLLDNTQARTDIEQDRKTKIKQAFVDDFKTRVGEIDLTVKVEAPIPETATVQPATPRLPVKIDTAEIQRTGKLPEGVTPEQATAAIQAEQQAPLSEVEVLPEGAEAPVKITRQQLDAGELPEGITPEQAQAAFDATPEIREGEGGVLNEIKLRLTEAGEALSPQQEFLLKDVAPLLVGGGAGIAAKGLVKALPAFAKLAASSPRIASILAGIVEGVGFETGFKATTGELPTAGGLGTSAAIFGGIPAAGAVLAAGKELVGKALPEALVKSAIKLKPTQKIKVSEELAKMGEEVSAETAEQFLLKNRISGSPEEVAAKLAATAKASRKAKLDALEPLTKKFKDDKVGQFADSVVEATEGVKGVEEVAKRAKELQNKLVDKVVITKKGKKVIETVIPAKGATLAEIDELKTLFDQNLNVFTIAGTTKEGVVKTGLANLRGATKLLIEKEAANLGVTNIKQLNQDVILNRVLGRAISGQAVGAGGNALVKLVEIIGATGVAGFGLGAGGFDAANIAKTVATMGIVVGGAKFFSPKVRIKLANFLSKKLNQGEAGVFLKFLGGDRGGIDDKLAKKIKQGFKEAGAKIEQTGAKIKGAVQETAKALEPRLETLKGTRGGIELKGRPAAIVGKNSSLITEAGKTQVYKNADDFADRLFPSIEKSKKIVSESKTAEVFVNQPFTDVVGVAQGGGRGLSDAAKQNLRETFKTHQELSKIKSKQELIDIFNQSR